ncbi:helix-turn-helix domain-containing protein [Candidatus Poribacteria bacterium]
MRTQAERRKFIQLRAEGLSFDKIARRTGISKRTLLSWSRKYESEIADLKAQRLEALREQYCLSIEAKVQMWGKIVNEIEPELARRRLSNVTSERLLDMLIKAQNKLEQAYVDPESRSESEIKLPNTTDNPQS